MTRWPDPILRVALWIYELCWIVLLPSVCIYLRQRGKRDLIYA